MAKDPLGLEKQRHRVSEEGRCSGGLARMDTVLKCNGVDEIVTVRAGRTVKMVYSYEYTT
jgi:hypothetical protein